MLMGRTISSESPPTLILSAVESAPPESCACFGALDQESAVLRRPIGWCGPTRGTDDLDV
jgi:hypothetical protein